MYLYISTGNGQPAHGTGAVPTVSAHSRPLWCTDCGYTSQKACFGLRDVMTRERVASGSSLLHISVAEAIVADVACNKLQLCLCARRRRRSLAGWSRCRRGWSAKLISAANHNVGDDATCW